MRDPDGELDDREGDEDPAQTGAECPPGAPLETQVDARTFERTWLGQHARIIAIASATAVAAKRKRPPR